MPKTPTDLDILDAIYDRYYDDFSSYLKAASDGRDSKIYVPIDCKAVANALGTDADIVFGRLYYDLEKRYGYRRDDGATVHFFALKAGDDRHAINFPYLASVVANLRSTKSEQRRTAGLSIASIVIAFIALVISIYGALV